MSNFSKELLKLILDTKALSIWNREKGPVFWYAAGVPGPFYVNTELMIGPSIAEDLLERITGIISSTKDLSARAAQLNDIILSSYEKNENHKKVILAMVEQVRNGFAPGSFTAISGGERRDWLFSIPFAKEFGLDHVFLFKDKSSFCVRKLKENESVLHVADLINAAASYFDAWFPALEQARLKCVGTACVNSRGTNGVQRLEAIGQKVIALNSIDADFFGNLRASELISPETLEEMKLYLKSSQEWASKYLFNKLELLELFDLGSLKGKSHERAMAFFEKDPWDLAGKHKDFFSAAKQTLKATG